MSRSWSHTGGCSGGLADGGCHRGGVGPRAEGESAGGGLAPDGQGAEAEPPMAIWVPTARRPLRRRRRSRLPRTAGRWPRRPGRPVPPHRPQWRCRPRDIPPRASSRPRETPPKLNSPREMPPGAKSPTATLPTAKIPWPRRSPDPPGGRGPEAGRTGCAGSYTHSASEGNSCG